MPDVWEQNGSDAMVPWYKNAVLYEVHVKSFYDSNGDGVGDLQGLIQKLDYLESLGVTALWLLPFYPSPRRDDGYDIADYRGIHPDYGTMADFRLLLRKAHARGIRIITELVLNHTSDQHPWFRRARAARLGSVHRDYYVWSDTPEKYPDTRVIFSDSETSNWSWDSCAGAYYWHRFYSHQPDLNFDSPQVRRDLFRVLDFWFGMGVDGMRLDAVPYLYEREGTNCENLPETHAFLRELRDHVDRCYPERLLLAEANQWPEDAVAYFGRGDECHMAFHFPVMPRMFMALWMEDRFPLIDIMEQTPAIPEVCQWGIFLRNHDELTLEMVTDEERDYMYRVYASDPRARINVGIRRRLAPLLNNNRRKMELMYFLLFSLPGTPVLYYGDEIGMGDNYYLGDRDGVRTPMQWSADRNAGFSRAQPQTLYLPVNINPESHYEAVNVETQERNPSSLLCWMRRVIAMRRRFQAFGAGSVVFLQPENHRVLAFLRHCGTEDVLVVVNLSRYALPVHLDLQGFAGRVPVEVFSGNAFPQITDAAYLLTLGPHDYYWFAIGPARPGPQQAVRAELPQVSVRRTWEELVLGKARARFEEDVLPGYLGLCRWYSAKAVSIRSIRVRDSVPLRSGQSTWYLLVLDVQYADRNPAGYLLIIGYAGGKKGAALLQEAPGACIARVAGGVEGVLYDGLYSEQLCSLLLQAIARGRRLRGRGGELAGVPGRALRQLRGERARHLPAQVLKAEQSNTAVLFGDVFFLKLFRRADEGVSPDVEVTRYLTEKTTFRNIPLYAGLLEYRVSGRDPVALGLLQGYVHSQGDAWAYTLDQLDRFYDLVLPTCTDPQSIPTALVSLFEASAREIPAVLHETVGGAFFEMIALLARRTAEMHLALARPTADPAFAPEPFSRLYQRSLYQSVRSLLKCSLQRLGRRSAGIPDPARMLVQELLHSETTLLGSIEAVTRTRIDTLKTRIHGDYHLGQVLYLGGDFLIIDFEGEPLKSAGQRRLKRSPLRDVAGMIRSLHYAACSACFAHVGYTPEYAAVLERWAELWYLYVGAVFLQSYLETVAGSGIVPERHEERMLLLQLFLIEKTVYEIEYEHNNRPDWLVIPLRGLAEVVKHVP